MTTKRICITGMLAAVYCAAVMAFAPISFFLLQFRVANVLKALAVLRPEFALGFAVGDFLANQTSPFGFLDWAAMPVFDFAGAYLAYRLRRWTWLAVLVQSAVIALGVATFPLGLGAGLPWNLSFLSVFASSVAVIGIGSVVLLPAMRKVLK